MVIALGSSPSGGGRLRSVAIVGVKRGTAVGKGFGRLFTIKQLADLLELNENQVRTRIDKLADLLGPEIRKGIFNRWEISHDGYLILERLREYERLGESLQSAVDRIEREMRGPAGGDRLNRKDLNPVQTEPSGSEAYWRGIAEERERRIQRLEERIETLHEIIAELRARIAIMEDRQRNADAGGRNERG